MLLLAQEAAQNVAQAVEIEEAQFQQISNLTYLLEAGGLPFLVMGLVMGIVGLILVLKPRRKAWSIHSVGVSRRRKRRNCWVSCRSSHSQPLYFLVNVS